MTWFFIALGAPFLWALVNIADQHLISKYTEREKERSSGGLVVFSSIIGIFIALVIAIFNNNILDISFFDMGLLLFAGSLTVAWVILYLYALEIEDVSSIAQWFLLIPVFGYVLGYVFLGETLTLQQITGSLIIFCGLILTSINFSGEKRHIKKKPVVYMVLVCLIVAVSGVIFKFVTVENNFWISSFWEYLGLGLTGLLLYIFVPKHRNEFMYMHNKGGRKIFTLNIVSELMTISGNLLTNFALLLAPVSLVYMVGSFQPVLVLGLTVISTKFFPHIIKEDISKKILIPKIVAVCIIILGSVVLFS